MKGALDNNSIKALIDARNAQSQLQNMGLSDDINENKDTVEEEKSSTVSDKKIANINKIKVSDTKSHNEVKYDMFIDIENIPSKNIFYHDTLQAQPLKVEDLLLIQTMDESNIDKRLTQIFSRRIKNVNPNYILHADELYLLLWLRTVSFNSYDFPSDGFICKNIKCDYSMNDPSYKIPYNQISWESNYTADEVYKLYGETGYVEHILPNGLLAKIQLKTRYHGLLVDQIIHHLYYNNDINPYTEVDNFESELTLYSASSFVDIGCSDILETAEEMKKWDAIIFLDLLKKINKVKYNVEPVINHICPKCGEVTPLKGYPFHPDKYIPIDF
jgi:hypothetical protein